MRMPKIIWEEMSFDDFKAEIGDYFLRVEQMGAKYWWWQVYFGDEVIGSTWQEEDRPPTELDAKKRAEECYFNHLSANQKL